MKQLWRKSRIKPCDNHQHWFIEGFPYFNTRIMTWFNENKIEELKSERIRELRAACKRLVNIGEWDFKETPHVYSGSCTYSLWISKDRTTLVDIDVYYPSTSNLKNKPLITGVVGFHKGMDGGLHHAIKILKRHAHRFLKLTEDYGNSTT